jgi:very-short-patch-repair endonuclease
MDFYFPALKINIEVDWVFHRGNKIYRDGKRDQFLKEKHWITTFRIWPFGIDIEEQQEHALNSIRKLLSLQELV